MLTLSQTNYSPLIIISVINENLNSVCFYWNTCSSCSRMVVDCRYDRIPVKSTIIMYYSGVFRLLIGAMDRIHIETRKHIEQSYIVYKKKKNDRLKPFVKLKSCKQTNDIYTSTIKFIYIKWNFITREKKLFQKKFGRKGGNVLGFELKISHKPWEFSRTCTLQKEREREKETIPLS